MPLLQQMVFFKPVLLENLVWDSSSLARISVDLDNLPLPFPLLLLGNKECTTKGGGEERRVREHDDCLLWLLALARNLLRCASSIRLS